MSTSIIGKKWPGALAAGIVTLCITTTATAAPPPSHRLRHVRKLVRLVRVTA